MLNPTRICLHLPTASVKTPVFAIFCLALSMSLPVSSETFQTQPAKFKGVVVDAHVARIPGASVLMEGADKKWKLETDAAGKTVGEINIELPAGRYKFTVEAEGFKRLVVEDFRIGSGTAIGYEFRLEVRDCDDCGGPYARSAQPRHALDSQVECARGSCRALYRYYCFMGLETVELIAGTVRAIIIDVTGKTNLTEDSHFINDMRLG